MGFLNNSAIQGELNNLTQINIDRLEPTGFALPQDLSNNSTKYIDISFDKNTRTFSISPKSPYTSYEIYSKGTKYIKTTTESIQIPDFNGIHYFYFYNDGTLKTSQTLPFFTNGNSAIAYVYWNVEEQKVVRFGLESHDCLQDWATHLRLHEADGCKYVNGLLAGNYVTNGDGSQNSHAQLSLSNGQIDDETLRFFITHSNTPTEFGEQILSSIAEIPVMYKKGSNGYWTIDTATQYAVKQGVSRITYNKNTAEVWTTPDATANDRYVAMWIFASTDKTPIFAIMGQREDSLLADAKTNNTYSSLDLSNLPFVEFKCLWRVIFQTNATYANIPKCKIVDVESQLGIQALQISAIATTDHNTLSNRTGLNSHPASAITNTPSGNISSTDIQSAIDELDTEKVDKTTTVNGHALSGNVTVSKSDVGLGNVVNSDTTTTANITDSTDKRFTTDAQRTAITHSNRTNLDSIDQNLGTTSTPTFAQLTVGNVSNTELQYLDGVTSSIQTQLNNKLNTIYYGSMYEDTLGSATTITVTLAATYYKWVNSVGGLTNGITHSTANDTLTLNSGTNGIYEVNANFSATFSRTNTTYTLAVFKNGVITNLKAYFRTSNNQNMSGLSINGLISLVASDALDLRIASTASADTVSVYSVDFSIKRIG